MFKPAKPAHVTGVPASGRWQRSGTRAQFVLAVPGLTVPFSHTAYLWVATLLTMAVHEVRTALGLRKQ